MHPANLQRLLQESSTQLQAGKLAAASRLAAQARLMAPRDFATLFLSGSIALRLSQFSEAAAFLEKAGKLKPASAPCALRWGFALAKLARHAEAELALRTATRLAPDDAEAWDTLGFVLKAQGNLDDAIAAHRRAVELQPKRANSWYNLGLALLYRGEAGEALACQERALDVDSHFAKAHHGRALALQAAHRIPECIASFDRALALEPANLAARSYRLLALNYVDSISPDQLFAEHAAFGDHLASDVSTRAITPRENSDVLRIGFLSPDLRDHSVAYFLEPLLAHLDPTRFEIYLYHDHFVVDAVSERLRGRAKVWRNFVGQSAEAVAAAIRDDALDVLVDLAGHTGMNRLEVFARRVAPVQVSYLGYPNTTGLKEMDFRFVDAVTDPVGEADTRNTEELVRFSPCAWSYQPPACAPLPASRPVLQDGSVTFGCFNNFAKVTDETLAAWSQILARTPGSRLLLKISGAREPAVREHVVARIQRAGLDLGRVELVERTKGLVEHLELYHRVDVALDTFPYHGTTTTCEALWMGVPVVTRVGDRHASRVGESLLRAIDCADFVAPDWAGYVERASSLAANPAKLDALSRSLRARMAASILLDHAAQASRFGAALRECCERRPALAAAS